MIAQSTYRPRYSGEAFHGVTGDALPYGNGRSYGDSCQSPGGTLILARTFDNFISFDEQSGTLECEPGVLLSEILDLVVPRGWFLPVVPGTQHVTVGGAIANDVHGKNHLHDGSFGCHVLEVELLRSDGRKIVCNSHNEPEWLYATIGGLGLTGVITRAKLRLTPIDGPAMIVREHRFSSLDGFFELANAHDHMKYGVAWVDSTAAGRSLGRGIFSVAKHSREQPRTARPKLRISVPSTPKHSLINGLTTRCFNMLYGQRPLGKKDRICHYERFLFPLDRIKNWNRLYGKKGFLQYQVVVPDDVGILAIKEIIERMQRASAGSFLTVLKRLGSASSGGMLSFPRSGVTFAVDFPNHGPRTLRLLDELDLITMEAGGAVYPAKDCRMSADTFEASFPRATEFRLFVDPKLSSGLWRRVSR